MIVPASYVVNLDNMKSKYSKSDTLLIIIFLRFYPEIVDYLSRNIECALSEHPRFTRLNILSDFI